MPRFKTCQEYFSHTPGSQDFPNLPRIAPTLSLSFLCLTHTHTDCEHKRSHFLLFICNKEEGDSVKEGNTASHTIFSKVNEAERDNNIKGYSFFSSSILNDQIYTANLVQLASEILYAWSHREMNMNLKICKGRKREVFVLVQIKPVMVRKLD